MNGLTTLASDLERDFLSKYPSYRDVFTRSFDLIRDRLHGMVRIETPFPHVWIERLFPEELYAMLADAWPPMEFFWSDRPNRMDLVPTVAGTAPADARASQWEHLPPSTREVWDFFVIGINRRIIGPFLERVFQPEIQARLALLESAHAQGTDVAEYLRPPFQPQMNVGRFMLRGHGYKLKPHVDALSYLVTALYYFPQSEAHGDPLGTTLYRVEGEISEADLFRREKTEYFHKAGITVHPAGQIPFVGNALLAFANTARSAHGMHITTEGTWRRAFQSHLSLKGDSDHL